MTPGFYRLDSIACLYLAIGGSELRTVPTVIAIGQPSNDSASRPLSMLVAMLLPHLGMEQVANIPMLERERDRDRPPFSAVVLTPKVERFPKCSAGSVGSTPLSDLDRNGDTL